MPVMERTNWASNLAFSSAADLELSVTENSQVVTNARVMEKMAGTESTAKITSQASTTSSDRIRGHAQSVLSERTGEPNSLSRGWGGTDKAGRGGTLTRGLTEAGTLARFGGETKGFLAGMSRSV